MASENCFEPPGRTSYLLGEFMLLRSCSRKWLASATVILALSIGTNPYAFAQNESKAFSYARLYADEDGISHFADVSVSFELQDYAPPAAPLGVSESMNADAVVFISQPFGWDGAWHPSPRRQFAILVSGTEEVTASDGEVRKFVPGDFILLEDTSGKGHASKVTSADGAVVMMVPLPSE
jgi:hypothetical protein